MLQGKGQKQRPLGDNGHWAVVFILMTQTRTALAHDMLNFPCQPRAPFLFENWNQPPRRYVPTAPRHQPRLRAGHLCLINAHVESATVGS